MNKMRYLPVLLSAALMLTAMPVPLMAEEEETEEYADIIKDVSYSDDGEEKHVLDLFGTQSYDEATPVVVEVHGGGFIGGTKEINTDHAIFYAEQGYTVVAPEYGKVPKDGNFTDTMRDLFECYNWIADNAEEYHFDLENIFISGDSAGGYYTLLTYAIWNSEELQEYFGVEVPDYEFSAVVTSCPATDLLAKADALEDDYVAQTIGEDILLDEDLMSHMDLYSIVDASVFEGVYMLTTPGDTTTGSEVLKFDDYLTENGVEHTTISYEGTENELIHVFNITQMDYVESQQANQDIVDFMNSFLK
ncbi:MAG: alpha/beta hydrolase [Clostridiales bacterium]|nr:alpha/beta hydrolase [Clostridiales bacterium]